MHNNSRGGKRAGAGRKIAPYNTKTIAFRVKVEYEAEIKNLVKEFIDIKKNLPI